MPAHIQLTFNGRCQEAFGFYAELLDGSIDQMDLDASSLLEKPRVRQALMKVKGQFVKGADIERGERHQASDVALLLGCASVRETWLIFEALAAGGQVATSMQRAQWAFLAGAVIDRFGIPWLIHWGEKHNAAKLLTPSQGTGLTAIPFTGDHGGFSSIAEHIPLIGPRAYDQSVRLH
jgi:PhnB protein